MALVHAAWAGKHVVLVGVVLGQLGSWNIVGALTHGIGVDLVPLDEVALAKRKVARARRRSLGILAQFCTPQHVLGLDFGATSVPLGPG